MATYSNYSPVSKFPGAADGYYAETFDPSLGLAINALECSSGFLSAGTTVVPSMQTIPDVLATSSVTATAGSVVLFEMWLPINLIINKLSFIIGVTAASTPTHSWAGVASTGTQPLCLAISADQTTTALAASTEYSYSMSVSGTATPYIVPATAQYYLFFCVAGTTGPTVSASVTLGSSGRGASTPYLAGIGDTGKTTPYAIGGNVTAPSSSLAAPLIYIS